MKKVLLLGVLLCLVSGVGFGQRVYVPGATVSTFAGMGFPGYLDSVGRGAAFNQPTGLAFDRYENLYVADAANNRIRKISPSGAVTTYAGSGQGGAINGDSSTARFYIPFSLDVDSAGNVYVADTDNNLIRLISTAGIVSTFAGSGSPGDSDGTGVNASFNLPMDVALDKTGNVYVADIYNNSIRKITPAGVVSTLAGSGMPGYQNGTGSSASFSAPSGLALDVFGNIYVADQVNNRIRKITPTGEVSTFAGSGNDAFTDGNDTLASFSDPVGLDVDIYGNVYVADNGNYSIRKITPAGIVTTLAGTGSFGYSDGVGSAAMFHGPYHVAVDTFGNIYVADVGNNDIRKITITPTAIAPKISQTLTLIPNPASNTFQISGLKNMQEITLFNTLGQQVLTTQADDDTKIDLHGITAGVYQVRTAEGVNIRLVKAD